MTKYLLNVGRAAPSLKMALGASIEVAPGFFDANDIVDDYESEILTILFEKATNAWAKAHVETAKAEGDVKIAAAKIEAIKATIKRVKQEDSTDQCPTS